MLSGDCSSAFAVQAICAHVEELQCGNPNARLLEDIRRILREELPALSSTPAESPKEETQKPELTQEQEARQAETALAFLKGF